MSAPSIEFDIRRQAEAARDLIRIIGNDDGELVANTIEGETNLLEAIEAALDEIDESEVLAIGLKAKELAFAQRREAIERRIDRVRAAIEQAMVATDQTSLRLPSATLSLNKRAPGVVVENEASIPARFWTPAEQPAPKLDRKALAAALAQEAVPGATLDNGSVSLSVRRK